MVHLTRYYMYKKINEIFETNKISGTILGVSGIDNLLQIIDMKNSVIIDVRYPSVDIQNLPFQDAVFDFVITDQVIEHVENPQQAMAESYRVLKKGGKALHTTCFINPIHSGPIDFWRFSPEALCYMSKKAGFSRIIQCEGWGNRYVILMYLMSNRLRFIGVPENKWSIRHKLATINEKGYPISTWLITEK